MYQTLAPLMLQTIRIDQEPNGNFSEIVHLLEKTNTTFVFLCPEFSESTLDTEIARIRQLIPLFRQRGIETGVWVGSLYHVHYPGHRFRKMVDLAGRKDAGKICPLDARFVRYYSHALARLADSGTKLIMLDDDFRINYNQCKPYCFCEAHLAKMEQILAEPVTRKKLRQNLLTGEPNRYRDAWLQANGDSLRECCRQIRMVMDEQHPEVNIALCSAPSSWGSEGLSPMELVRILAGSHQPVLRMAAAPYWVYFLRTCFQSSLANIIDLTRYEASVLYGSGIQTIAEGDTYPRPRYCVPASSLELFDLAVRADGKSDGILKYMFDYVAPISYEQGYVDACARNLPLYQQLEVLFAGKTATGFRPFDPYVDLRRKSYDTGESCPDVESMQIISAAARFLNDNSIPSCFEPGEPCVVFGDSARTLGEAELADGTVLDLPAALLLQARGIDTGVRAAEATGVVEADRGPLQHSNVCLEVYADDHYCPLNAMHPKRLVLDARAKVLSYYALGEEQCCASFLYENEAGQKFFVLNMDAGKDQRKEGVFRNYYRQKQLEEVYQFLTGRPLDAVCMGHPDLYLMTKKDAHGLSVGLWNFSLDAVEEPVITLGRAYSEIQTLHCTGTLSGTSVSLSRLGAQEFCAFSVR